MSNGKQRSAIVIGGASGIGWATAQALAARKDRVTVADLNADGARRRAAELGDPHTAEGVDVTNENSVERLFGQTGPVDIVVNCAGFSNVGLITDMPVDQFRDVVDVCLTGAFIVAKHAGRSLRPGGVLVSISSLNGRQPAAGMSAYCAAKAGLSMLTQVAALELGPKGIRVNAVAPGFVHTPLTEPAAAVPGVVEEYVENTALGRAGTPEDIAGAVLYLCSPDASWLTGEVLDLNGGAHLKRYPDILGHVMKLAEAPR
jgi:3-oxoacyl-[acyl-carrier protein] reductase